jgi:periplasmic protein TonB
MGYWDQDWGEAGKPGQIWTLAVVGSLLAHGLLVAGILLILTEKTAPRRVVVPVEAIALVPAQPGPKGGGSGQPAPMTKPEPAPPKPAPPRPQPRITPKPPPRVKPAPPPTPTSTAAPVIPTPAAPAPITRAQPGPSAAATSGAKAPGVTAGGSGSGQAGSGGGQGAGSGGGVGSGHGRGSGPGSGSALQSYLRLVRQLLEKHKDYPSVARQRHVQGVVVVVFTIGSGGQIMAARVSRSSGQDILDEAAQNTIRRVGQFPPLPIDLYRQQLTVEVPLAFRVRTD